MINTILKNDTKNKLSVENILNDVYLLPKWEIIKTFCLTEHKFLFKKKLINVNLFRKFSSRNLLEKYLIKTEDDKVLANMDLKVYKDCVYIINLNINSSLNFEKLSEYMLQTAVEKALYNTSEKEVYFNLTSGIIIKNRIKKILLSKEFMREDNQSSYEKEMFGETFFIKAKDSVFWTKKIKQMPVLINDGV